MEENPVCEFHLFDKRRFPNSTANDPHHIFSQHMRPDLWSNLLAVSRDAHDVAEQFKTDMRIVAIYIKVLKGECDRDEFKTASGKFIEGYLMNVALRLDWVAPMLLELQSRFP